MGFCGVVSRQVPTILRVLRAHFMLTPLLEDQRRLCPKPDIVFDIGSQYGDTTKEYVELFPRARVFGFEPAPENFAKAETLLRGRAQLVNAAVSDHSGTAFLNINTHSGTHSLFAIGALRFWKEPATTKQTIAVPCVSLDDFCSAQRIERIDILKMDIQGAELRALEGARRLLASCAIGLLAIEVEFQPLYEQQPLFEDLALFLRKYGYGLYNLYDLQVVAGRLSWADAIFVCCREDAF